jgi:poly-gamma-glutamate capsule biosynthesis protein CapA/YwtB (metallophosphatase superfamily)
MGVFLRAKQMTNYSNSQEVMDKATANLQATLQPIYAQWADALMRKAYNAGRRDGLKDSENIARLFDLGTPDGHAIADSIRKLAEAERAEYSGD